MDRRSEPEGAVGGHDDRLQQALTAILGAYRGDPPETVYRRATDCFEGLMEISDGAAAAADFAARTGNDLKYLVDGANFVISMMHMNPRNNFYVTLGLPPGASADEIRERWKRLMLLYHPDRQGANSEWFAERAKKVNEAYSVLKSPADRAAFDRKLAEETLRPQPARLRPAPPDAGLPRRAAARPAAGSGSVPGRAATYRRYLPVMIVGCYISAAAVFLVYLYLRGDGSSSLESALQPVRPPAISRTLPDAPPPGDGVRDSVRPSGGKEESPTVLSKGMPAAGRPAAAGQTQDSPPAGPAGQSVGGPPVVQDSRPEAAPARLPVKTGGNEAPQEPPPAAPAITRAEVDDFLRRYAEGYRHGRIEEFMRFFSRDAVENGSLDYEMIRTSYRKTFAAGIAAYRLEGLDVRVEGGRARISGVYNVSRYTKTGEPDRSRRGRISWTLVKEDNTLKILEARYDD